MGVAPQEQQPNNSRVRSSIPPAQRTGTIVPPLHVFNDFGNLNSFVPVVTNQSYFYQIPATAGLQTPSFPTSVNYEALRSYTQPASGQFTGGGRSAVQPHTSPSRLASASQTAIMYGANPFGGTTGMNFNIMGANKPKKLDRLTHEQIKRFKSDFTQYHHETNGQATLLGHISDDVISVIDSLLGAQPEHQHLLCHGEDVNVRLLSE